MSLFDDTVFGVTPTPAVATTEAPTPNLRASTAGPTAVTFSEETTAPTLAVTSTNGNNDDDDLTVNNDDSLANGNVNNGTLLRSNQVLDGDDGFLTSLRYYDALRKLSVVASSTSSSNNTTTIQRKDTSNVDLLTLPETNETIAICHVSLITSFTYGDFVPQLDGLEDTYSIALALHHLNTGDGSIVPQVAGLNQRCKIRFTAEFTDDQGQGGEALRHLVEQTARTLPAPLPCAFIGNSLSSITIPTSIVSGFLGYPQVSAYATSVDLDDRSQYPLFGRTIPSDQGNAIPIIKFMHDVLKLKYLSVINVNDAFGNAFVGSLRDAALVHAPGMQIRQFPLNDESDESIQQVIQSVKETNYRFIFCIVFTPETNDALLLEAYKNDMAGNGVTNWLFGDSFANYLQGRQFSKDSVLAKAYQGIGLVEASGGLPGMKGFDKYASQMLKLKNPTDLNYVGSLLPKHNNPSYPATYKENPFIFQKEFLSPVTNTYSPFHYEAAIGLGLAACEAAELNTLSITGRQQYKAFRKTNFTGIGGSVAFDPVSGTRLPTSTLYRVTNWIKQDVGESKVTFQPIVSTLFVDGIWEQREAYIFNDGTTQLPLDIAPPPEDANLALAVALPIALAFILGVGAFIWLESKRRRNDSVWKVDRGELKFSEPPVVIGQGTFGTVLLAEYRGTQVAVKHVIPRRKCDRTTSSSHHDTDHSRSTDNDASHSDDEEMGAVKGFGRSSWGGASLSLATASTAVTSRFNKSGNNAGHLSTPMAQRRESDFAWRRRLRQEFLDEMRYLSKLRHPCVTTIMGAVVDKEEPMMIMEYMDHGSLYDLLHNETVALEGDMLLNFLKDITQGVRFLHSAVPQVIHGDLKAANILVDNRFRAKVADFGLSQKKGGTGTPFWMAPELLRKESTNTAATDVYSFGIILYEVYSRRDPYEGEDPKTVIMGVIDDSVQKRPPVPKSMCDQVKQLMIDCLDDSPMLRPSFEELDTRLKRVNAEKVNVDGSNTKSSVSLFDIFPRHIAEALRDGRPVEAEHRDVVTIFFSDIVGFTDISATLDPRKVASMLGRLYTKFDNLSQTHEVFKLETIGDAYVAVTNLVKDQPNDHARRIAEFAIDAIVAANETLIDDENPSKGYVNIRVGFHCGPVVADVVGTSNMRYCLFGDAVNTASRMESNSRENRIHCSDAAAKILKEQCPDMRLQNRGKIKIKGKGEMRTWWVNEGVGKRRMSRDGSEARLLSSRNLASVRENLSAEFTAEQPSEDFAVKSESETYSGATTSRESLASVAETTSMDEMRVAAAVPEGAPSAASEARFVSFVAPPGKLGIVLDTSTGTPSVYQVHHTSAIREHIAVGDIVCEIDGVDTRSMSNTAISALMLANAGHERHFKVKRM
ncbi:hypothetical protein MPSEU_000595800 [Mayamaea pseudoterrestris]|nr:hypothetical protein MPSEU_000595800 [Mayamaea pseudoterrestris]